MVFEHREASIQRGGELGVVEEELLAVGRIAGAEVGQVAVEDRGELGGGRIRRDCGWDGCHLLVCLAVA